MDIEYLIDPAEKTFCVEGIAEYICYKYFKEAEKMLKNQGCPEYIFEYRRKKYTEELKSRIYNATRGIFETSETDAAARTYIENHRYISYRLFKEARETLERFKNDQTSLIGHAENTADLEDRIDKGLERLTKGDIYIPAYPEGYKENDSTIQVLVKFYRKYNEINRIESIDKIRQEDEKHKKWGILGPNFQELEGRSAMRERILTTSKALRTALKMLCRVERGDTPEAEEVFIRDYEIPEKFLQDTEYDDEGSNETYNIIPFDGLTDRLPSEVQEAIKSLKCGIDAFPSSIRGRDVLDCLQKCFGFQESSVSNQRENIVNLLSNELMRFGTPGEQAFDKSLGNYIEWCNYLRIKPIWNNMDDMDEKNRKKKRILYISLYYLIWGEAANVRFLPECLCYIFHRMGKQLEDKVAIHNISFIEEVIRPLYEVIAAEAVNKKDKDVPHSKWRNYDDFNEHFWSPRCKEQKQEQEQEQLGWPINVSKLMGKPSFIERRTFWHLYHSFHRMWILHVMMFQALVIFAFNDGKLNSKTLREILSVGPTYFLMKLIQSMLDIGLKYGAYSKTSRVDVLQICFRFIWFMLATYYICFLYMKCLQEMTSSIEESIGFKIYITVLGIYAVFKISFSILSQFLSKKYKNFLLDLYLEEEYVGCGMAKELAVYITYMIFWLVTLAINISYTYHYLISPLVRPTRDITDVSKNIHNMLAIGSLWAGVICAYIVGSHVSYNVISAFVGTFVGHTERLGNIKSLGDVPKLFDSVPKKFMDRLNIRESPLENNQEDVDLMVKKLDAAEFSPFWNQIVMNLREEDYISDKEQYALSMPKKSRCIDAIQWPPFLLVGKVSLAIKIAAKPISQEDMWDEISRDAYMKYAVEECFHSVKFILCLVLDDEGKKWVHRIYKRIKDSIKDDGNLGSEFQLKQLENFVTEISKLMEALKKESRLPKPTEILEAKNAVKKLYLLGEEGTQRIDDNICPTDDSELWSQIERLHLLLTMDKPADPFPENREARRRLEFFTNSLFMSMPTAKPVREMLSFSVLTPYYEETVLYSLKQLLSRNDDGVTLIDYLKNLYPGEWTNHCERMMKRDTHEGQVLELRLWASYRGQTLARTVRGTMYYQKALLLQAYREMLMNKGSGAQNQLNLLAERHRKGRSQCLDNAKAHVDLKFTYVVSCQIYGKQKSEGKDVAADIAFLLKKNEGLRVAFIDEVFNEEGYKEFYSKLVKADKNGKEMEVYSIKLPGDPILGEGKPENQNHAIVFTRGNAIQTIDMNQDNYFEETLKMRNLLEEFHRKDVIPPPTILGIREYIFSGSASYLASFMSNQETSFVTLGQRVMAKPLNVRMHYGHPDVFDRVFHITRGGISKASLGINISEDIYAGFNSTLRNGRVTHHEYIQVGKGRDVGFNQIATFEGKVAGGNGEQVLSRDIYRLGQRFDFFRMLSFYHTSVGYYFSSLLMVITLYILLYGNLIMALSGTRVPHVLNDTNLTIWWLSLIVLLPSIYMVLVIILEQGYGKAVISSLSMFYRLCSIFFAFSLGTRIHWFGRTIIHGGASYQATGRGFVLHNTEFSENYRLYSRSHFVKGMEVLFLLVVYGIYGFHPAHAFYNNLLLLGGLILSISWIVAPFLFVSSLSGPTKKEDWNNWLNYKSVPVDKSEIVEVKAEESWEVWWNESHIRTFEGRVIETILCLRFFIFPYVVGYKLDMQGLWICGAFWLAFVLILFATTYPILPRQGDNEVLSMNPAVTIGALVIAFCTSHVGDLLAFIIAFITTLWGIVSICVAWKPTLVTRLAKICDAGMGKLMFNIERMLSIELIRRYLVRNMFDRNVFNYLREPQKANASRRNN